MSKKIFALSVVNNGFLGTAFLIGAVVYDEHSKLIAQFLGRSVINNAIDGDVEKNINPKIMGISVSFENYHRLLGEFAMFYLANKQDADIVGHLNFPANSAVFHHMATLGLIGERDVPYPFFDIVGNLQQTGEDVISLDLYSEKWMTNFGCDDIEGGSVNPLYRAMEIAQIYHNMRSRFFFQK